MPIEASEVAILQGRRVGTLETGATQKWPAATRAGAAGQMKKAVKVGLSPRGQPSGPGHRSLA